MFVIIFHPCLSKHRIEAMNIILFLTRSLFIFFISSAGVVHAGQGWGANSSYQINQMNQAIQNMNQVERMNQNIMQMNQTNQLIQMNQMEQMNQNILQRNQINQDINQINQTNQILNIQRQIQKQNKAGSIPTENIKQFKHHRKH